jgi:hypothetical protein
MNISTRLLHDQFEGAITAEVDRVEDYHNRFALAGDDPHRMDRRASPVINRMIRDEWARK